MPSPRSTWTGSISFGLVNIPIRLHTAVREQRVAFHMLHDQDKVRLQRKMVCPADGQEVHPEHIIKGYPIAKDQYVVVQDSEIQACAPESSRTVEITDFVDLDQIDPIYYVRTYYTTPTPPAAKPYRLLLEAMTRSGKVGIAKMVMHNKEYLVALRPRSQTIAISTMNFADEVVPMDELGKLPGTGKIPEREMKAATQLIESLVSDFKPEKYRDEYRDCIQAMVEKKAAGEKIVQKSVQPRRAGKAMDLMSALEASLEKAKGNASPGKNKTPSKKRKSKT